MADSRSAIGVFDSGVGGIGTLAQLRQELPQEDFVYYGDTAHAPYGTKTPEEVLSCVRRVMDELLVRDVKAVVIACNTATSVAAAQLRAEMTLPIIGMEPALKPAAEARRKGKILVLATPVTLRLEKFARLMERYGEGAERVPCPGLMELVEAQDFAQAEKYLTELLAKYPMDEVDSIVLGCTHYVFLRPVLMRILPEHVRVFDGNVGTAKQLRRVLDQHGLLNEETRQGSMTLLSSSASQNEAVSVMYALLNKAPVQL